MPASQKSNAGEQRARRGGGRAEIKVKEEGGIWTLRKAGVINFRFLKYT